MGGGKRDRANRRGEVDPEALLEVISVEPRDGRGADCDDRLYRCHPEDPSVVPGSWPICCEQLSTLLAPKFTDMDVGHGVDSHEP